MEHTDAGWRAEGGNVWFTGERAEERAWAVECARDVRKAEAYVAGLPDEELDQLLPLLPPREAPLRSWVKKTDEELQVVWSEVYLPDIPDAHGQFMRATEIRKMAWAFLAQGKTTKCDLNHDNKESGCRIVESFIARKGDPDFIEGSWVVGMHIPDQGLWQRVKKGEFNGFSMQARVFERKAEVELLIPEEVRGTTDIASDGSLHRHSFVVRFDSEGQLTGGSTGLAENHRHGISRGSITETAAGHFHRYNFLDKLFGVPEQTATGAASSAPQETEQPSDFVPEGLA